MKKSMEQVFEEIILLNFQKNYIRLQEIGLYPGQEIILGYIIHHEGGSQSELVSHTKKKSSTIAKAIQRMEQAGYVCRKKDEKDKRIYHLYTTHLGKETYDKIAELKKQECEYYNHLFTEEEKNNICSYLIRVRDSLKGVQQNEKNR